MSDYVDEYLASKPGKDIVGFSAIVHTIYINVTSKITMEKLRFHGKKLEENMF